MRRLLVQMQDSRDDVFLSESLLQPAAGILGPSIQLPGLPDALHIFGASGEHDTQGPHLVLSDLAFQSGIVQPVLDRFRAVGHSLGELYQFFIEVGKCCYDIGGCYSPLDVSRHGGVRTGRFFDMQYNIAHNGSSFR